MQIDQSQGTPYWFKTKMDAGKIPHFTFWNVNFSAVIWNFHTSFSQISQCICMFVSTRGLRETWPLSVWTEQYKIFMMSWHHPVNQWTLCMESHKPKQWPQMFQFPNFNNLLYKMATNLEILFYRQVHMIVVVFHVQGLLLTLSSLLVSSTFIVPCLSRSTGAPITNIAKYLILAHPDLLLWVIA